MSGRVAVLVSAALASSGCVSYHAMPFIQSQVSAAAIINNSQRDGLHVAVRDISNERLSTKHFGRHLRDEGFIPVQLLIELDAASSASFDLRQDEIQLVLRDGTRLDAVPPLEVIDSVGYSHWRSAAAFLFILPGPFVVSSVNRANASLEEDYLTKALRSIRVSRNLPRYEGVLFFRIPEGVDSSADLEDGFVELTVDRKATSDRLGEQLVFPVHFVE